MKTNNFKYLDVLGMIWVSVLVLSTFTAQKLIRLHGLDISVVMMGYPITYIFSDIFTEVYGYKGLVVKCDAVYAVPSLDISVI